VCLDARQPVAIVTKNARVTRDLDLLREMATLRLVHVSFSITTLDRTLARAMEPQTSTPEARLRAIARLSEMGVPAGVLIAPVIPGLTDVEIPAILRAAKSAGACGACYAMLRLPASVQPVFLDWLDRALPDQKDRILSRLRDVRGGKLNDSQFGRRLRGEGEMAEQIRQVFHVFAQTYGLGGDQDTLDCSLFRRPETADGQMRLFE
jgi:DNA repair photolyase